MPVRTPAFGRMNRAARERVTRDTGHLDLVLDRMSTYGNSERDIPGRVVLVRAGERPEDDHLFLDQVPIPRDAWTYDEHDRVLTWKGAFGGGRLLLSHDGRGGHGSIGPAHDLCSVNAGARARFLCDVAPDVGATYVSSGTGITGFDWDPTSAAWTGAAWQSQRLLLTYTVTPGGPIQPPTFTFEFEDLQTGAVPWDPGLGSFEATLGLGLRGDRQVWDLSFKSDIDPGPDQGLRAADVDTVYPWWLQAVEDSAALGIDGVLEIDAVAPNGTLVGMRGVRAQVAVTGYYRTSPKAAPFGVFDGRLVVGGKPVPGALLVGDRISWTRLDAKLQQRTGLPASGTLVFAGNGSTASTGKAAVAAGRLDTATALTAITEHRDLHKVVHQQAQLHAKAVADPALDMFSLLAMTPYAKDDKGVWRDAVQTAVTQDLSDIMNSCIPPELWKLLFDGTPQTKLTGDLAEVAGSPVSGVADPTGWYRSLATAVLSHGMSNGSEDHCRNLNGPRAQAWLTTEVARSKVYAEHGQRLFTLRWQERNPLTSTYQLDQITNADTYQATITEVTAAAVADIGANVITDGTSAPDLKNTLIADVQDAAQYATTNNLFWAFAYHTYNTAPAVLANISLQMAFSTGAGDGGSVSRLLQQNVAVLTALDPSGYYAQRYLMTMNAFLATNVLPSMFGFQGDAMDFELVKEYLQTFVKNNLANEDKQIADAAAQIGAILSEDDADTILHDSIELLQEISSLISDTMALPYIANKWVKAFGEKYPKFAKNASLFGSMLIGGIAVLGVYSMISGYKRWSELDKDERADLVLNTVQFALQLVSAVVKRGVRIYAIFNVNGLSTRQRTAAISRIMMSGEAEDLAGGMNKVGNATARWLGGTQGVAEYLGKNADVLEPLLRNSLTEGGEEATTISRIFGANLDEFVATRLGPILILAGMGVSIARLAEGEATVDTWADALNIVGGSLMLLAMGGEFLAEGVLATVLAFAGPLAILVALAGVGLMIYEMFKKQPDPIADFVTGYAKPAGFWLENPQTALDYAVPFQNPDQSSLMMIGCTLSMADDTLRVSPDGSVSGGAATALPDCVWQVSTDGYGMSTFATLVRPDVTKPPLPVFLSVMDDGRVSFQPKAAFATFTEPKPYGHNVVTQTWLGEPIGAAELTSDDKFMVTLDLRVRPVLPDGDGDYAPDQAQGWLALLDRGLVVADEPVWMPGPLGPIEMGTRFMLDMSGMAPNFSTMRDLKFQVGTAPSPLQTFGPSYGVVPSTPITFANQGDPLPPFLGFDTAKGLYRPNGQEADHESTTVDTVVATNACGSDGAKFAIAVVKPPQPAKAG